MKLIVLGSASGAPAAGRPTSGYLVESDDGKTKVLIDIGSGVLMTLKGLFSFDLVDDVIVTHGHADHIADASVAIYDRLISTNLGRNVGKLRFYTTDGVKSSGILDSGFSSVEAIDDSSVLHIGPFTIRFHRTIHPMECYAAMIEGEERRFVYTSDGAMDEGLVEFSSSADLLLAECSLERKYDGRPMGHMNTRDVAALASAAAPKLLVLVHTPTYADEKSLIGEVAEFYDGPVAYAHPLEEF